MRFTAEVIPYQEHWDKECRDDCGCCSFFTFLRPENILGTIFLRPQLTYCCDPSPVQNCSQKFQHAPQYYFAPITCCLASFHAHTYYHALLITPLSTAAGRRLGLQFSSSNSQFAKLAKIMRLTLYSIILDVMYIIYLRFAGQVVSDSSELVVQTLIGGLFLLKRSVL